MAFLDMQSITRTKASLERTETYRLARRVARSVSKHDVPGLSAELAYRALLAVFPFLIFAGALSGYIALLFHVDNPAARIITHTGDALPADAASVLERQLQGVLEAQEPGLLWFGLIGAIIIGSAAMNTLIKAFNRIYNVEETRPFWLKTAVSLGLTLLGGAALVAAFTLLIIGQVFGQEIADQAGLQGLYAVLVSLARWPVIFVLVLAATTILYRYAPARRVKLSWASAGALVFSGSWAVATFLFGLYIARVDSYQVSYGALAGVVILMLWFYVTAFILLLGGEINRLMSEGLDMPEDLEM
jgi:membrane protein